MRFPRGLTGPRDAPYDFSFSGLKTSVARHVEAAERAGRTVDVADVCASFQEAVVDVLTAKTVRGRHRSRHRHGGDRRRRRRQPPAPRRWPRNVARQPVSTLRVPRIGLCTDNGAMIAAIGAHVIAAGGEPSGPLLTGDPGLPVSTVSVAGD